MTYGIMVRGGWVGGEEDGERGDEEEGEHGGDEDPVREEAPQTESTETRPSSAPASSDCNRHWIQDPSFELQSEWYLLRSV